MLYAFPLQQGQDASAAMSREILAVIPITIQSGIMRVVDPCVRPMFAYGLLDSPKSFLTQSSKPVASVVAL